MMLSRYLYGRFIYHNGILVKNIPSRRNMYLRMHENYHSKHELSKTNLRNHETFIRFLLLINYKPRETPPQIEIPFSCISIFVIFSKHLILYWPSFFASTLPWSVTIFFLTQKTVTNKKKINKPRVWKTQAKS